MGDRERPIFVRKIPKTERVIKPRVPIVRPEPEPVERPIEKVVKRPVLRPGEEIVIEPINPALFLPQPVDVLRPDDLLWLRFAFINLKRNTRQGDSPVLSRNNDGKPAYLVVTFPAQHIIEQAFFQQASGVAPKDPDPDTQTIFGIPIPKPSQPLEPPPVRALISGPTRLVFKVTGEEIPYTSEGLIGAMQRLELSVAPQALPPDRPKMISWFEELAGGALGRAKLFPDLVAGAVVVQREGLREAVALDFVTLSRMNATAAVLEHRFGSGSAVSGLAGSRLGGRLGLEVGEIEIGPIRLELLPPLPDNPGRDQTAIELPWRLILSPNRHGGWAHAVATVVHNGRTELWHTRLGVRSQSGETISVDEKPNYLRAVRAIWARDFQELAGGGFGFTADPVSEHFPKADQTQDQPQMRTSLNSRDRMMLVHETANFHLEKPGSDDLWRPPAVPTKQLMLSALGGWLDSRLMVDAPKAALTIEEWKHRAGMGRDHHVKVVYAGFLLPFCHRASLIKVTERKIEKPGDPAYLYQRMFIAVREPEKTFDQDLKLVAAGGDPNPTGSSKLQMPFSSVRIVTSVTPDLDDPNAHNLPGGSGFMFCPYVAGAPFPFKLVATDREGNLVEFKAPLVFMERDRNEGTALTASRNEHNKMPAGERRMPLNGQRMAFADSKNTDDTALNTEALTFDVAVRPNPPADPKIPRLVPVLNNAEAVVPAMSALAGAAAPVSLVYPDHYKEQGFTGNAAEVFLQLKTKAPMDFSGQGDRSGGLVTPSLSVSALSRSTGPIGGDPTTAIGGQFNPADFFAGITAKLFGVVSLADLLPKIPFDPNKVPKFVTQALDLASTLVLNMKRLGEAAAALGAAGDALEAAVGTFTGHLTELASHPDTPPDLVSDLNQINGLLGQFSTDLDAADILRAEKEKFQTVVAKVRDQLTVAATAAGALVQAAKGLKLPEVITARLDWSTEIPRWGLDTPPFTTANSILQPVDAGGSPIANGKLTLAVDLQAPTQPGKDPSVLVSCSISPFDLQLIAPVTFMVIRFEKMEFSAVPGKKPDVNVVLRKSGGIVFKGPLEFINTLKDLIPFDGFSDPPYLDVTAEGINAGFDLPIPSFAVGVFSLENIALGASFRVPFIDESLDVGFYFCTREDPFRLTVMLFGGGGFFGITLTPDGVRILEAAFEFGAAISINLGVASGGVSIMAGIYFKMETKDGVTSCQLSGYFRLRGEVDVLGLISACIELYMELTYETATKKAIGRATISVEVEVLFLSFSVSISCEKKFAGGNDDPTFVEQMGLPAGAPPDAVRPWDSYCRAFADA